VTCVWLSAAEIHWTTNVIYWTTDVMNIYIMDNTVIFCGWHTSWTFSEILRLSIVRNWHECWNIEH